MNRAGEHSGWILQIGDFMKRKWLSLKERIDLSLRHLTLGLDWRPIVKGTALEGVPFCHSYMGERLVELHAGPDLFECPGRYLTALSLCLDANPSFSSEGISAEKAAEHLARYLHKRVNQNGKMETTEKELAPIDSPRHLFFAPLRYGKASAAALARGWWNSGRGVILDGYVCIPFEGLVRWFLRTGDPETKKTIERMIRGKVSDPARLDIKAGFGSSVPPNMTALSLYYEATGDEAARRYLEYLASHFLKYGYLDYFPDGKHSHGAGVGHLHSRLAGIAAFARYAKLLDRADYLSAAEELFVENISFGTEFGWMPERHIFAYQSRSPSGGIYQPWAVLAGQKIDFSRYTRPRCGWDTCEICVTADAVDAAIVLAKCGYERYWDVAERYLNHIFEAQIRDDSFIVERKKGGIRERVAAKFENVRNDILGSYLSSSSPVWAVPRKQYPKMRPDGREGVREGKYYGIGVACCHGWGARTLGLVWRNILTEEGNRVEVNFPFDKKTEKVEVKSSLPFAGRISVKALKPVELLVRIPDWVEHSRVEVRLNGKRRENVAFKNTFSDYVKVGRLKPGERAEVRYPLRQVKKRYHIEYHPSIYEVEWLGNFVLGIKEIPMAKGQGEETFEGFGKLYDY